MSGHVEAERRHLRKLAWLASRTGWLAQVDPRKQPSIDKLVGERRPSQPMSDGALMAAMQAWASVTKPR